MDKIALELVKMIPSVLWFFLIVAILILFYRPIRNDLLPKLGELKAMGVELSFVKEYISAIVELAEKSQQWKVEIPPEDRERALNRVKKHLSIFRYSMFLWVDDHPENNLNERKMFHHLNVGIDTAKSTQEALEMLKHASYDLVLSDMSRGEEATAGIDFLEQFREMGKTTPVIFYIGVIDPAKGVPGQAFGITNRPDELLHLALDALERKKY